MLLGDSVITIYPREIPLAIYISIKKIITKNTSKSGIFFMLTVFHQIKRYFIKFICENFRARNNKNIFIFELST